MMRIHRNLLATLAILVIHSSAGAAPLPPEKMKPEEVVAKHLASIGTADALAAIKSVVIVGDAKALSKSAAVPNLPGIAQLASEGDKVVMAMIFDSINYPHEKAGFDGQKVTVSRLDAASQRTALGDFFMSQESIFRQGLIGGVLSSAWPLLNTAAKKPKLSYAGLKKIDDRQVHELKYTPGKGGDLKISLYFDAETFRHVRTEYSYVVSNRMGGRPQESVAVGTNTGSATLNHYKLIEDFSDFQTSDKLTLPRTYKLRLSSDARGQLLLEWVMNFKQFAFNQPLETTAFNVSATK